MLRQIMDLKGVIQSQYGLVIINDTTGDMFKVFASFTFKIIYRGVH